MEKGAEHKAASFWLYQGILYFIYKEGAIVDIGTAKTLVEERIRFQNEKDYPVLCDIRGVQDVSKEARDYLALEGTIGITALAILIDNPVNRIISEVFVNTSGPAVPTQIFEQEQKAIDFLIEYLKP